MQQQQNKTKQKNKNKKNLFNTIKGYTPSAV